MKCTIGVVGSSQIEHLIPVIAKDYNVINIQEHLNAVPKSAMRKFKKAIIWFRLARKTDLIYWVFVDNGIIIQGKIAKIFGNKILGHWIGSDVRLACEGKSNIDRIKEIVDCNVVCFGALGEKLKGLGIDAEELPITPFNMSFDIARVPEKHAALVYMPEGREDLYGLSSIKEAFKRYPEITFYIVANNKKELFENYKNVEVLGMLSLSQMTKLYEEISMLVRIHVSDGLSMMVLEALAKGKQVIWDHDFPFVMPGGSAQAIIDSIAQVISEPPRCNHKAHDYIVSTYTEENFLTTFNGLIEKVAIS